MEKLIELLNEYEKGEKYNKAEWKVSENNQLHYKYVVSDTPNGEGFSDKYLSRDVSQAYLISSKCGFIKWLVENDKINRDKVDDKFERPFYGYTNYEIVLMLISISDTPIEDLLLYLK